MTFPSRDFPNALAGPRNAQRPRRRRGVFALGAAGVMAIILVGGLWFWRARPLAFAAQAPSAARIAAKDSKSGSPAGLNRGGLKSKKTGGLAPGGADASSTFVLERAETSATPTLNGRIPAAKSLNRAPVNVVHERDFPPYEFVDEENRSEGYSLDVVRLAAKRLGIQVHFLPASSEDLLRALDSGEADLTAAMVYTPEREDVWYLGEPWVRSISSVYVLSSSPYKKLQDLQGKKVAVVAGGVEHAYLTRMRVYDILTVPNTRQALSLLSLGGLADAAVCNREAALYEAARIPKLRARIRVLDAPLHSTQFCLAGLPRNRRIVDMVDRTISEMREDGSLEAIHVNWFLRHSDEYEKQQQREQIIRWWTVAGSGLVALAAIGWFFYNRRQRRKLERLVHRRTRELARSEQHYRALFDHARDAILLVNPESRLITEVNPSTEIMAGRSRTELVGRPIGDLFPPDQVEKAYDLLRRQLDQDSKSLLADLTVIRPSGGRVIIQARCALVRLKESDSLYVVFRDVTDAARAHQELEQRNNELRIQNAMAIALQRDLPLGCRLGKGLDAILELEEFRARRRGLLLLRDWKDNNLTLGSQRGLAGLLSMEDSERARVDGSIRPSIIEIHAQTPLDRAAQGELVFVDNCHNDAFLGLEHSALGEHGHYLVPLRAEGRVNGVLCLFTEPYVAEEERRRSLLEGIGGQLGIVIESDHRQQILRDREHRLQSISQIAISLGSSLDLSEQLKGLFHQIRRVMPADAGNVWVSDQEPFDGDAEQYYSFDTGEDSKLVENANHQKSNVGEGTTIYQVFAGGEPLMILRSEEEASHKGADAHSQFGLERRSRSLLYVPLKYKNRVIGVLTVQSYRTYAYTQETVDVLMSLSAPLAIVIENARLFAAVEHRRRELDESLTQIQADLKAAQAAQESLLPREFPRIKGWEFASIFIPSQYVGGDFYNIFQLDERHYGLFHIDVSGHGVPAALFSVGLNQYLMHDLLGPGFLREPGATPGSWRICEPEEVVTSLDQGDMFQKHQRFYTMLYLIMNVETGLVRFYRAGHNQPLLVRPGEPPCYLEGGGSLVGFHLPRSASERQELQMQPGDRLIIYSDGLNEAANSQGELYGMQRMADFLANANGSSFQNSFEQVVQEALRFSGESHFEDDVSMIGLSWDPRPGSERK